MSLLRRIRHQATRRQFIRGALYCYVIAFIFIFLDLHFAGITHYSLLSRRENLPVNAAVREALLLAVIGPLVWVLEQNARPGDWWTSFSALDSQVQRLIVAGAALLVFMTVVAWRWVLPLWGLAVAVALYLRLSRPKNSL